MARKHRKYTPKLNPLAIPDHIKRDLILEGDAVFSGNMKVVNEQRSRGAISSREAGNLRDWLVMSSLRRNHVPLREARRLAVAG